VVRGDISQPLNDMGPGSHGCPSDTARRARLQAWKTWRHRCSSSIHAHGRPRGARTIGSPTLQPIGWSWIRGATFNGCELQASSGAWPGSKPLPGFAAHRLPTGKLQAPGQLRGWQG
jgi:hypothetical protein